LKPLIGITGNHDDDNGAVLLKDYYVKAIRNAGGIPLVLPPSYEEDLIKDYIAILSGVLLSGGGDLDPAWWGENPMKGLGRISPLRDYFEIQLTQLALHKGLPVLGICRGCQVMNVARGGSLIQDLPGGLEHNQNAPRDVPFHGIVIAAGSNLASILKRERIRVNSFHHQAVKQPGQGLIITACSLDGIIEAVEDPRQAFFIGVQWHPECLQDEASFQLFNAFVASAQKYQDRLWQPSATSEKAHFCSGDV
jgi:putative glutamine amidotransferase